MKEGERPFHIARETLRLLEITYTMMERRMQKLRLTQGEPRQAIKSAFA